jgi:acetate kinase
MDALIFTAGIGENSHIVKKVLEKLKIMKIQIDEKAFLTKYESNQVLGKSETFGSQIMRIRTNEELMIAKEVKKLI